MGNNRNLMEAHHLYGRIANFQGLKCALEASTGLHRTTHFLEIGAKITFFSNGEGIAEFNLHDPAINLVHHSNGL